MKKRFVMAAIVLICIAGCGRTATNDTQMVPSSVEVSGTSDDQSESFEDDAHTGDGPVSDAEGEGNAADSAEGDGHVEDGTVTDVSESVTSDDGTSDAGVSEGSEGGQNADGDDAGSVVEHTTQYVDDMFTLYTRDGAHCVIFPSLGSIMGVQPGVISGQPDVILPTGKTLEYLNGTYGTGTYTYDQGRYTSAEECLTDKVPDDFTIESYYPEGYEAGPVVTSDINGYTVFSQAFSFYDASAGHDRRFWHVALQTRSGHILELDFAEGSLAAQMDTPLTDDWYKPLIEAMVEQP